MASEQDIINTLIAEAFGEGEEGMRRVAETILNRSAIRGITPEQVVTQPSQYTGYWSPGPAARQAQSNPAAISAAQAAWQMAQGADDPTGGADHYFAPGSVSTPRWANSMQPTGSYGGHSFYSSQPVPQRAAVAPTPASQSAGMAASRAVTSPSGGNTALQSALAKLATATANRVTPQTMQGRATTVASFPTARPSASDSVRGKTPMYSMTMGGRAPIGLSEPGNLDLNARKVYNGSAGDYRTENSMSISTDRGEALIPTVVNGRQLTEQGAIDHYLSTGQNLGMFKTPQAADQYAQALHLRQEQKYAPKTQSLTSPGAVNASVGSTRQDPALAAALAARAGVGKAPTTRTVQTTRVGNSANNIAAQRNEQAMTRQATPLRSVTKLSTGVAQSFAGQDRAPGLSQARLGASAPGLPALYGTMSQNQVNAIGYPLSNKVSPLNGQRVTSMAPTPLQRPGGFGSARPQVAMAPVQQAPVPMQRPGVFGAVRAPVVQQAPVIRPPVVQQPVIPQPMQPARAPLNILVQGSNTVQPAPVSVVQGFRQQGLSPSEAYAAANMGNNPVSVFDKVRGERDSGGSGGVQPRGTIW